MLLTRGVGEPTYGGSRRLVLVGRLVQRILYRRLFRWTLGPVLFVCESRSEGFMGTCFSLVNGMASNGMLTLVMACALL